MKTEQLSPQLLQQYREAGFNFVLLHEPFAKKIKFFDKRSQTYKPLKEPIDVGKAPIQNDWPQREVSHQLALEHMKGGKNVGVQMSSSGYAVIDYDPRNDPNAGKPDNALVKLLTDADMLGLEHASVTTGSLVGPARGRHIYVKVDPSWRGRTKLDQKVTKYPGVEFKHSPGQQVVAAGSVHPSGGCYRFDEESLPLKDAQKATAKLLEIFEVKKPNKRAIGQGEGWGIYSPESIRRALMGAKIPVWTKNDKGEEYSRSEFVPGLDVDLYSGDHDKWLQLMMACHYASGGEAADAWVEWSGQDSRYVDDVDINRERWDTFTEMGNGSVITEATMFQHFNEGGLHPSLYPSVRVEKAFEDLSDEDLLIESTPEGDEARILSALNRRHAMVMMNREAMYVKPGVSLVDGKTPQYVLVTKQALRAYYENKFITVFEEGGGGKVHAEKKNLFDFWNTHPKRREYQGMIFKPSIDSSDIDLGDAGVYLNMFQGWPYSRNNRGRGEWNMFRDLIYKVLAQEVDEWFDYIIKWMAYSVQNPERPQQVLMVFQGPKGVGKSLIAERWKRLFGNAGVTTQRMEDLTGQFNSTLSTTCALLMEEGIWAGDKAAENRLKQLITGESVRTEAKFSNAQETANYLAIIMNTNEQWAVPATPDERRFAVFEAKEVWPKNHPHFGQIIKEMDYEGGMQAFFYDLLHMELDGWRPQGAIPMTPALAAQMSTTLGPVSEWWGEVLELGECPFSMDELGGVPNWGDDPIYVHWKALKEHFRTSQQGALSRKWARNFDKTFKAEFGSILPDGISEMSRRSHPETEQFFGVEADKGQTKSGTKRSNFVMLPPLSECICYARNRGVIIGNEVTKKIEMPNQDKEQIHKHDEWGGEDPLA